MLSAREEKPVVVNITVEDIKKGSASFSAVKSVFQNPLYAGISWLKSFYHDLIDYKKDFYVKNVVLTAAALSELVAILNWKPDKASVPEKTAQIFKVLIDKFNKKCWADLCELNADFIRYGSCIFPQDFSAICANRSDAAELIKGLKLINQFYPKATLENSISLRELLYQNPVHAYQMALAIQALYKDKDFSEEQIIYLGKKKS